MLVGTNLITVVSVSGFVARGESGIQSSNRERERERDRETVVIERILTDEIVREQNIT